jgi:hypothetical protein
MTEPTEPTDLTPLIKSNKLVESTEPTELNKPIESVESIKLDKLVEPIESAESPKSNELNKPVESVESVESSGSTESSKSHIKPHVNPLSDDVLFSLDLKTKLWAESLSTTDVSYLLQAMYNVPGLIKSLKYSYQNSILPSSFNYDPSMTASAEIGKRGEMEFARLCKSLPENYRIVNTSKQGKQGDFVICYTMHNQTKKCLVDIKKYTTSVPKKEIDKFYDDLNFGHYDAGLLISYHTKFVGISEDVYMTEHVAPYANIPVLFLSNTNEQLILQSIKVLMLKTIVTAEHSYNIGKLESMLSFINNAMMQSSLTRRNLSDLQNHICSNLQKCQENLTSLEVQVRHTMKEMERLIRSTTNNALASSTLSTSSTSSNLSNLQECLLLKPPGLPQRDDNVEDKAVEKQPESLPVQTSKLTNKRIVKQTTAAKMIASLKLEPKGIVHRQTTASVKSQKNDDDDPSEDVNIFKREDRNLVRQIYGLPWESIENNVFELYDLKIILEPLKTKTRVRILSPDEVESDLFEIKGKKLTATLNQEVANFIQEWVEKILGSDSNDELDESNKSNEADEGDEAEAEADDTNDVDEIDEANEVDNNESNESDEAVKLS